MPSTKKLPQYRGRLEPVQITDGINAALQNARRLADDAALLLENDRYARAASLAILSIEESGKVSHLRHLSVAGSDDEVKGCWRSYRSHTAKNVLGGLVEYLAQGACKLDDFIGLFGSDAEYPRLLDQVKQLGFYTDCLGDAHWSEPHDVVDKHLAQSLLTTAQLLSKKAEVTPKEIELWVKHLSEVWNRDPGWVRKGLENWYEDMQAHGLAPDGANEIRQFVYGDDEA